MSDTYFASWWFDNDSDIYASRGPSTEADSLDEAKAFLDANRGSKLVGRWWCLIERGTYAPDASWEPDSFYCVGEIVRGRIQWHVQSTDPNQVGR